MQELTAPAPNIRVEFRSPNHTGRRGVVRPDMVVLHYTGMADAHAAIQRLCDPDAEVSAHYVVDLDGSIYALVDEDRRAWHAGRSQWGGVVDVNSHSIGIEIVNPGHELGYPPFPEPQMASVEWLVARAMQRWEIVPERIVGHACIAPGRKIDPGEKFDWRRLARQGLAIWLDREPRDGAVTSSDYQEFAIIARRLGYAAPVCDRRMDWSEDLAHVWRSVRMRFLPDVADKAVPDSSDIAHLERLARRWPVVDPKPITS